MLRASIVALSLAWPALLWGAGEAPPSAAEATGDGQQAKAAEGTPSVANPAPDAPVAKAPEEAAQAPPPAKPPDPAGATAEAPAPVAMPAEAAATRVSATAAPSPAPAPAAATEATTKPVPAAAVAPATSPSATPAPAVATKPEEAATLAEYFGHKPPLSLSATAEYRQPAIVDQDPANDLMMLYDFSLTHRPEKGVSVFLTFGLQQRFVAEGSESGWLFKDVALGAGYSHKIPLSGLNVSFLAQQKLALAYSLRAWLPTSRASINQDLHAAPEARASVGIPVLPDWISLSLDLRAQYRFHQYAERVGGDPLNRFVLFLAPALEAEVLKLGSWGNVVVQADVNWGWVNRYPPRSSLESAASGRSTWAQDYGWDLGVAYQPKPWAEIAFSVQQGAPVLRDGVVNVDPLDRDETELVLDLSLTF
ncbi:MAG: hypothetical protein HY901_25640 [Deltaproteobacteria bacterium]|nr:hypothetical protein [Deltaproteobacteria bacterium]